MTRKHFNAIADALAASAPVNPDNTLLVQAHRETVLNVARNIAQFNDNFDRERFLAASGVL